MNYTDKLCEKQNADGRRVAWRETGEGAPALFMHCALAHSGALSGLTRRLGDVLAARALDLPGHGGTGYDPGRRPLEQAVEDALSLLGGPPAHLIGHSFGGAVGLRVAAEAPARVASLTLIEPVFFSLLAGPNPAAYAREIAAQRAFHAAAGVGDWRAAAAAFLSRWGASGLAELPPAQADYVVARLPLTVASEPDILLPDDPGLRLADLDRVNCPVLLIEGTASPAVVGEILDVIAGALPRARRRRVAGAGHMVPVTHPDAVAAAIRGFLG